MPIYHMDVRGSLLFLSSHSLMCIFMGWYRLGPLGVHRSDRSEIIQLHTFGVFYLPQFEDTQNFLTGILWKPATIHEDQDSPETGSHGLEQRETMLLLGCNWLEPRRWEWTFKVCRRGFIWGWKKYAILWDYNGLCLSKVIHLE